MYSCPLEVVDVNETEAEIVEIYINNNEYVKKGDTVCTVETTKVAIDIEAQESGYIEFLFKKNDKVKFGEILFIIKESETEAVVQHTNKVEENPGADRADEGEMVITKKAREFMAANGIKEKDIGKKGLIKLEDVKELLDLQYESQKTSPKALEGTKGWIVNNRKRIVIIGGGAGGEVVADILLDNPECEVVGFIDDNPRENFSFYGIKVIYDNIRKFPFEFDRSMYDAVIISFVRDLKGKKEIFDLYTGQGIPFINAIDKSVRIGRNTRFGTGNVIGANVYIGTSTEIGNNNWVAASVNIDHHNVVGDHNLFGPNFASPGVVKIGNFNMFGANSSLNNCVEIGNDNIIMNNMSVYRNVKDNEVIK